MSYSFEYIDIILLAMIAGFIFLRLRGILGKRTGFEGKTPAQFKEVLKNIQSGKFAKEWMKENETGQKNFLNMRKELSEHQIEQVGEKLRALMPWISKNKIIDKNKN